MLHLTITLQHFLLCLWLSTHTSIHVTFQQALSSKDSLHFIFFSCNLLSLIQVLSQEWHLIKEIIQRTNV